MIHRLLLAAGLAAALAACGIASSNPGMQPQKPGSYYDQSDNFLDKNGYPLAGWDFVRDSAGGGGGGGGGM